MPKIAMPLRVNVFPGGFNWPSFIAIEKGFCADHGVSVTLQPTANSVAQMTGLARGDFEIAMTAVDNIVAYVQGHGEALIGPQPDFFAFMASDSGFLDLVADPAIGTISQLEGRTVSVDAFTTGYAFVLYEILRLSGLPRDTYKVQSAGGMVQRWRALQAGLQSATLLSTPYNFIAAAAKFTQLANAGAVIGPYQGNVGAARRSWARDNPDAVIGFIRAYRAAVAWLYDPANQAEALAILSKHVPQVDGILAERTYGVLVNPVTGFYREPGLNQDGMRTVLALRQRYGERDIIDDVAAYFDPAYLAQAFR